MSRGTTLFFVSGLLFCATAFADPFADGLCTYESTAPNLQKATCYAIACPPGANCRPPKIDAATAAITFKEPTSQWKDSCPDKTISGACVETYVDYEFHLGANGDSAQVSDIGVNIVNEIEAKRIFKRQWGKAIQKDSQGRYFFEGGITVYVPPGKRYELSVYELCARDGLNNEQCVLPQKSLKSLNADSSNWKAVAAKPRPRK